MTGEDLYHYNKWSGEMNSKNLDLVLVNTPALDYSIIPRNDQHGITPLGLVSIASYCRAKGLNVEILDADDKRMPVYKVIKTLNEMAVRFVGLNAVSENIALALRIARGVRHPIIIGGVHATLMSEETFRKFQPYALVRQEGEQPVADILMGRRRQDIPGIVFEDAGKVISNPCENFLDLERLPVPDISLFKGMDEYFLVTSRGCTRDCAFCASPVLSKRKARFVPMEKVIEEMIIALFWGRTRFHFLDDEFLVSKKRAQEFLHGLRSANLFARIRWRAIARADVVLKLGDDIIQELKDSGGELLAIGVGSGSKRISEAMHRGTTTETIKKAVGMLKKHGFKVKAYVILGFLDETYDELMETRALLMELGELGLSYFSMTILRPYPGTRVYAELLQRGYLPEDIFFADPSDPQGIDKRFVYGFCNRLNDNIRIAAVPNQQIMEIAEGIIREFNERFCPKSALK